jgi:ribonuclease PH
MRETVAATSVGHLDAEGLALDLCYVEDSAARVDLNVVATSSGKIVEVQGTAEGAPVARRDLDAMVDLALSGIDRLSALQREAIASAGVDLAKVLI